MSQPPAALAAAVRRLLRARPELIERVQSMFCLVSVSVSWWRGRRKMRSARTTLGGQEVPREAYDEGHWKLMPPFWAEQCRALEQQAGALLAQVAVPFRPPRAAQDGELRQKASLDGVHLVLAPLAAELLSRLAELDRQLRLVAEDFCSDSGRARHADYLKLISKGDKAVLDEIAPYAEEPPERLKAAFGIGQILLPTAMPRAAHEGLAQAYAVSAFEQAAAAVEAALWQPRASLAEAALGLRAQLAEDTELGPAAKAKRGLRAVSLQALEKAMAAYRNFESLADGALLDALDNAALALAEARVEAGEDPVHKVLNKDDELAARLAGALGALATTAVNPQGLLESVELLGRTLLAEQPAQG